MRRRLLSACRCRHPSRRHRLTTRRRLLSGCRRRHPACRRRHPACCRRYLTCRCRLPTHRLPSRRHRLPTHRLPTRRRRFSSTTRSVFRRARSLCHCHREVVVPLPSCHVVPLLSFHVVPLLSSHVVPLPSSRFLPLSRKSHRKSHNINPRRCHFSATMQHTTPFSFSINSGLVLMAEHDKTLPIEAG